MEFEYFIPTVKLLREIVPDVRRVAVIVDTDPTWKGVMTRMRSDLRQLPDIDFTDRILIRTLSEFKARVEYLQGEVDALAMLGVFNIQAENGIDVDCEQIQQWLVKNSKLPDFPFGRHESREVLSARLPYSVLNKVILPGKWPEKFC